MSTKDYSSKQEKMIADYLGWSVVSGSGAAACYPGDIISDEWLGECKTHMTSGNKIVFNKSHWKKICDEAFVKRRYPVLFTDDGSQKSAKTWCLFRANCIDPSSVLFVDFPDLNQKTNIGFHHDELMSLYWSNVSDAVIGDEEIVFRIPWNGEKVAVTMLSTFHKIFQ